VTRLLIIVALIAGLGLMVRRAVKAAMHDGSPKPPPPKDWRARRPNLPPERLVCGACGHEFDPEKSGWICPKCKQ
jgi:hypothetical protein